MIIKAKDLFNLPVETKGGKALGRVSNLEIDADGHRIIRYYVKSHAIGGLLGQELIIHADQVISITSQKMIVEDNIVRAKEKMAPAST